MSLYLCGKRAKVPFYYGKLNMRFTSLEEVCYVISRYPLIAVDGLVNEGFVEWIRENRLSDTLAEELAEGMAAGESSENLLLKITQSANYLTIAEIRSLGVMMADLRSRKTSERLRLTGKMYLEAGRYRSAYEKFEETLAELEKELGRTDDELETAICRADRADVICDMVAVCALRFDYQEAERLLEEIEPAERIKRAEEYRYYLTGDANLSEAEKTELREKKHRLEMKARSSGRARKIKTLSSGEYTKFAQYARDTLKEWKREYRRMI